MSIGHCFEVLSVLEELAMKIPVQSKSRKMDVQNSPVFILSTVTTSTTPLTPPRRVPHGKDRLQLLCLTKSALQMATHGFGSCWTEQKKTCAGCM